MGNITLTDIKEKQLFSDLIICCHEQEKLSEQS